MRLIAACGLLLICTASWGLGRVVSYAEIQGHLFGSIQGLETCGQWRVGERFGDFRVIRVYYAGQDMLFVDMVALDGGGALLSVEHGFSFSEVNNDHAEILLESVTCRSAGENRIDVEARAINGHNDERYNFNLRIDGANRAYSYSESR